MTYSSERAVLSPVLFGYAYEHRTIYNGSTNVEKMKVGFLKVKPIGNLGNHHRHPLDWFLSYSLSTVPDRFSVELHNFSIARSPVHTNHLSPSIGFNFNDF